MPRFALFLAALILFTSLPLVHNVGDAGAAETAETVLIRQTLEKDRFGRRRGDVDLIRSAHHEDLVVYGGNNLADPVGWTVQHEDPDSYIDALAKDLASRRYNIDRTVLFLTVLEHRAIGAVVDSGDVVDRSSGESLPFREKSLWSFEKVEDRWLAIALVQALGDSAAGRFEGTPRSDAEVVEFLKEEAAAWNSGDAGAITGSFAPEARIIDGVDKFDPLGWLIIFSGLPEYGDWLDSRLQLVDYELQREILHSYTGPTGTEALAVGRERLAARHRLGAAEHTTERLVLWTLSKRTGDWSITNLFLNVRR